MKKDDIRHLLEKYRRGQCSEAEKQLVITWYAEWNERDKVSLTAEELALAEQEMWANLQQITKPRVRRFPILTVAVAALVLAILSVSIYLYYFSNQHLSSEQSVAQRLAANDVVPGQDRAMLTLTDGQTVELLGEKKGIVAGADGINYTDGSEVPVGRNQQRENNPFYTLSTPRGGQYNIVLPDGSKVWLNAASSLRYPSRFEQHERRVYLTGEAYFEVEKVENQAFIVETANQEVNVLGTHFNVNAYENEPVHKTTLLEGRVNVTNLESQEQQQLVPGEQSAIADGKISVRQVDTHESVAWKDGYFLFNNTELKSVMRQLTRWYNIEVGGLDQLPGNRYNGKLPKNANLSKVLQVLEMTSGLKFEIQEGRRVILMD